MAAPFVSYLSIQYRCLPRAADLTSLSSRTIVSTRISCYCFYMLITPQTYLSGPCESSRPIFPPLCAFILVQNEFSILYAPPHLTRLMALIYVSKTFIQLLLEEITPTLSELSHPSLFPNGLQVLPILIWSLESSSSIFTTIVLTLSHPWPIFSITYFFSIILQCQIKIN